MTTIADFLDLEAYFKQELNGKHLTSEQLCDEVFRSSPTYMSRSI